MGSNSHTHFDALLLVAGLSEYIFLPQMVNLHYKADQRSLLQALQTALPLAHLLLTSQLLLGMECLPQKAMVAAQNNLWKLGLKSIHQSQRHRVF
jgi:hypothetical protein